VNFLCQNFLRGLERLSKLILLTFFLNEDALFLKSTVNDTFKKIDNEIELASGNAHPIQSNIQINEFSDFKCNQPYVCLRFLDNRCYV